MAKRPISKIGDLSVGSTPTLCTILDAIVMELAYITGLNPVARNGIEGSNPSDSTILFAAVVKLANTPG